MISLFIGSASLARSSLGSGPAPRTALSFSHSKSETGIANAIVDPDLFGVSRSLVTYAKFLLIDGTLQNVDKVIHISARHIEELDITAAPTESHDFY